MNLNRLFLILILLMMVNITNAQKISDLYTFVINDTYKELLSHSYMSKQDTLHFTCGFCDCRGECFDYDIDLKNDKIKFTLPTVDKNHSEAVFYRLSTPELENKCLVIDVGVYIMVFREDHEEVIYSGTTQYIFRYDKKMSKYVFKSKKEYGL